MKEAFWKSDWFAGLIFCVAFLFVAFFVFGAGFQSLERAAYDLGVRASSRTPSDRVAVIAIDDQSIQNIGRWPWPRDVHARMLALLKQGGAKVVGSTVLYTEPQVDAGLAR